MHSRIVLRIFSTIISRLPRIKGLGILIALVADGYKDAPLTVEKSVWGNRMRFRTDDLIGRMMIFSHNYYDYRERRLISALVEKGDHVVDVGANIGIYTLLLSKLVGPEGTVEAVEAEQRNAAELAANLALNQIRNVTLHHCGVSDSVESLPLLLNTTGNAGGHSFYDQSHIAQPKTQLVECRPLAAVIQPRKAKFMKLDIEGLEHRVLKRFFSDVPKALWPEHLMLENDPNRREDDPVALCISVGYVRRRSIDYNVFLQLEPDSAAATHS